MSTAEATPDQESFVPTGSEGDITLLPAVRKPMSPAQREQVVEVLTALLLDYWQQEANRQAWVSYPRSNVGASDSEEEIDG